VTTKKSTSRSSRSPWARGSHRPVAQTMEELLRIYGGGKTSLKRGDKVVGKVIAKEPKRLILDIGAKGEGIVAEKAYQEAKDFIKELKVGDDVNASVIVGETPDGFTILSLREAMANSAWKKLEEYLKDKKPVIVLGKTSITSGVTAEVEGLLGFIPSSQLGKEVSKNPSSLVGKHFKALVIDLNRAENKIVLSEREVSDSEDLQKIRAAFEAVREGEIYDGVVTVVSNFGCFVKIQPSLAKGKKTEVEGLVHISEISWGKVESISDLIKEGDKVKVKVIAKNPASGRQLTGKLAFSIKQAQKDPWDEAAKKYKKDTKVKGKAVKVSDFGVFVELEEGIEGLVHITKIPPGMKLEVGKEVNVIVEEIDVDARRISLGLVLTKKPVGYK
jgi:small subunit ribosomal protein S1